jgi:DNA repair ATPase RecN
VAENFEVQLAILDERVRALRQIVEGSKFNVEQVHALQERLTAQADDIAHLRDELRRAEGRMDRAVDRVEESCNNLGEQMRTAVASFSAALDTARTDFQTRLSENVTARLNYRSAITVAAIAAIATILAGKL